MCLSFETAQLVFDDPLALSRVDPVTSAEERWQTVGMIGGVAVLVIHTASEIPSDDEPVGRIKGKHMKKANSKPLTARQSAELKSLASLADTDIDTRSIAEVRNWRGARRGVFFRPLKQQLTLRLDAEIIAWFRKRAPGGKGYQSDINAALRAFVVQQARRR